MQGKYMDILTQLVERGNALWAAEWDRDSQQINIQMSNVVDLSSPRNLDVVDYDFDTQTLGKQITWATIRGGAQPIRDEEITLSGTANTPLALDTLVPGSETVRAADDTRYVRGNDYSIEYSTGQLARESGGNIADGETVFVDYRYKPNGSFQTGDASERTRIRESFIGAVNDSICRGIAYYLVQRLKSPVVGATATIDDVPPGLSLLDVFAADPLPSDVTDSYYIQSASVSEGQVQATIQSRRPTNEIVSTLNQSLGDVEDRV